MSLASATNRVDYTGNGSVDTYSYTFKIFAQTDLLVTVRDTSGVETELTLTTDYTVTGVGASAGGTIVLVNSSQAWLTAGGDLKSSYALTIRRVRPVTQSTDIRNQGEFYPETHEDALDHLIMVDQQQQDELDRSLKLPETVSSSDFNPILPSDILDNGASAVPLVNATADGWADAADWPTASEISGANASATAAAASATLASQWATKVDDYVSGTDNSAKAWSVGGTGNGQPTAGPAKDWATKTSANVDGSEFSAKEYAQGTQAATGGSSKNWAQETGGDVTGAAANSRSAKSWAQDANTGATLGGSAKDWAQNTSVPVDGSSGYSSKEWATGTQTRGAASGGSAKDWANYTGGTVDNAEYSAKKYATDAAASAASAAAVVAAAIWNDVSFKAFADSPISVVDGSTGTMFEVDCTSGNVVINLPQISGLTLSTPWAVGIRKSDSTANTVTINPYAGDEIDGSATALTLDTQNQGYTLIPDTDTTPDTWTSVGCGDLKNLNSPTITTPTINGGTIDLGTASNTNKLVLPAESTANLAALTDDAGFMAFDTTRSAPVYNDGTNWREFGGGSGVGNISYFEGIDLSVDTTNVSVYDDTGAYVDGTGGSPAVLAIYRDTSDTLTVDADLRINKSVASGTGEGVTLLSDTIENADLGRKLWVSFEWDGTDANYVSEDLEMYAYDVTNSTTLPFFPVAGFLRDSTTGVATLPNTKTKVLGYIIPSSTTAQVRISLHLTTDNASAATWDCYVARPRLSPEASVPGAIMAPAKSFTPTGSWSTNTTYTGQAYRIGNKVRLEVKVAVSGAPTTASLTINYPSDYPVDTAKMLSTTAYASIIGYGMVLDSGSATYPVYCRYNGTTSFQVQPYGAASTYANDTSSVTQAVPMTWASGDELNLWVEYPVQGWSTSAALSTTEIGLQTAVMRASGDPASAASGAPIIFPTKDYDNQGWYSTTTGLYTVQKTAKYRVHGYITSATSSVGLDIAINGTAQIRAGATDSNGECAYTGTVTANKGDTIGLEPTGTLDAASGSTLCIEEIPDFTVFSTLFDNEDVELFLDTGNGHGATNTKIRRFTNTRKSAGSGVYYDYADSSTNGMSVTIKVPGLYSFYYNDSYGTGAFSTGLSVNGSLLTTSIADTASQSYSTGRRAIANAYTANEFSTVSISLRLNAGDIVRAHTDGTPNLATALCIFQMIRVGN